MESTTVESSTHAAGGSGQRRRKSPDERLREIRAAARALALEEGLASITLRAVAARAGVAPALVAHYLPSMDELVAQTFASVVEAELADLDAALEPEPDARAALRTLTVTILDGTRDDVTRVWVDAWSIGRRNAPLAAAVSEQSVAWQRMVADVVRRGLEAGEVLEGDAEAVAWQFLGLVDGLNAQSLIHDRNPRDHISMVLHVLERELGLADGDLAADG